MRQQSIDQGASLKGVPRPWGSTASSVLPGSAESLLEPSILPVPKGGGVHSHPAQVQQLQGLPRPGLPGTSGRKGLSA